MLLGSPRPRISERGDLFLFKAVRYPSLVRISSYSHFYSEMGGFLARAIRRLFWGHEIENTECGGGGGGGMHACAQKRRNLSYCLYQSYAISAILRSTRREEDVGSKPRNCDFKGSIAALMIGKGAKQFQKSSCTARSEKRGRARFHISHRKKKRPNINAITNTEYF